MMAAWKVYFYLEGIRRDHTIKAWLKRERISRGQIAAFQDKLDTLEQHGPDMLPGFISDTPVAKDGIRKMKVKGNKGWVQLRPLCHYGPFGPNECTLLFGATEKDGVLMPKDAKARAQENLTNLKADPTRRTDERLIPLPENGIPG